MQGTRIPLKTPFSTTPVAGQSVQFARAATRPAEGLPADLFLKPRNPALVHLADRLKALLRDDQNRREHAAAFVQALTAQKTLQPPGASKISETARAELENAARTIQSLKPGQRLDLIQYATGPTSIYSRMAEVMLRNQLPMRTTMHYPEPRTHVAPQATEASTGAQAAAFGMLMLSSLVMPAVAMVNPTLLVQAVGTAAALLL